MPERKDIIDGASAESARDGLIYTCVCGWIDLGHARPDGARKLWNAMLAENTKSRNGKGHHVTYRQLMKSHGFGVGIKKQYWVKANLSKSEREAVALSIFMDVSLGFEALQSVPPFKWRTDSGFSAEDLVSNLLGFYRAVRPRGDYISLCKPVSKDAALKVWDTHGAVGKNKNYSFSPFIYPCSECGTGGQGPISKPLPYFLNSIMPARAGELFRRWSLVDAVAPW